MTVQRKAQKEKGNNHMAYHSSNVSSFRDDSSSYPKGGQGRGPATVPGTTGSNDRESQPIGAELNSKFGRQDNVNEQPAGNSFSIFDRGSDDLNPKVNPSFGKRTYAAETPTL